MFIQTADAATVAAETDGKESAAVRYGKYKIVNNGFGNLIQ